MAVCQQLPTCTLYGFTLTHLHNKDLISRDQKPLAVLMPPRLMLTHWWLSAVAFLGCGVALPMQPALRPSCSNSTNLSALFGVDTALEH
jgi:hypothetical protein